MKTILIVDDSRLFRNFVSQILEKNFKVVGKGTSGIEGYELYQKLRPDLVLMDITMPDCNGKESLKLILDHDPLAKVIMFSGLGDEFTINECIKLGVKA